MDAGVIIVALIVSLALNVYQAWAAQQLAQGLKVSYPETMQGLFSLVLQHQDSILEYLKAQAAKTATLWDDEVIKYLQSRMQPVPVVPDDPASPPGQPL